MEPEIVAVVGSVVLGPVIFLAWVGLRDWARQGFPVGPMLRPLVSPWPLGLLGFGLLLVVLSLDRGWSRSGLPQLVLVAGLALGFLAIWIGEIVHLMALRDDERPGRFDKPIWAALLILLPPVGLVTYRVHRSAMAREARTVPSANKLRPRPTDEYARELA